MTLKRKKSLKDDGIWGYLFIAPPFIGVLIFLVYPLLSSLYISMSKYNMFAPPEFIGFANYIKMFTDDKLFLKTLLNTFYAALGVPIGIAFSIFFAVLLNQKLPGKNFFRALFFLPTVCSIVAISLVWQWIFNADYGLLNQMLASIGIDGPGWLIDKEWAMPAMIIQGVWGGLGVSIIFYLAALGNIPRAYYEAATMDGAGSFRKFWYITLPGISPVTFFILVTSLMGAMQDFTRFMILTGGGPNYSTTTSVYYVYNMAFQYNRMGYASAVAWIVGIITMIITVINLTVSKKWVHYE